MGLRKTPNLYTNVAHPRTKSQVADFGMARLIGDDNAYETTLVRGTYGYMAPEYALSGRVSMRNRTVSIVAKVFLEADFNHVRGNASAVHLSLS
jgi:serine/threonine protein kinase